MSHKVYRNGKVFVMARQCKTCIFRPGEIAITEERREEMVRKATKAESTDSLSLHYGFEDSRCLPWILRSPRHRSATDCR